MSEKLGDIWKRNVFGSTAYVTSRAGIALTLFEFLNQRFAECVTTGSFITNGTLIPSSGIGTTPVLLEKVGTLSMYTISPPPTVIWEKYIKSEPFYIALSKIFGEMIKTSSMFVDLKLKGIITPLPIKLVFNSTTYGIVTQNYMDNIRAASTDLWYKEMNTIGDMFWEYLYSTPNPILYSGSSAVLSFTGSMLIKF